MDCQYNLLFLERFNVKSHSIFSWRYVIAFASIPAIVQLIVAILNFNLGFPICFAYESKIPSDEGGATNCKRNINKVSSYRP